MPSLVIDRFLGLDKKSSDTDLDKRIAKKLENLSTTKKNGALSKDGAYTDVSTSLVGADLPASRTRKSLFELSLTSPSVSGTPIQDIYLCHATNSGGDNEIYVGKYWDGSSAFVSNWLELSEAEGAYTTDATTTASSVISNEPVRTTTDYYKGWWIIVTIGGVLRPAIITASSVSAGVTTFTVTTGALNGIAASGEAFSLFRYNISSGIASATIDDDIRWKVFENSVIGMLGNTSIFPTQFNLWYGYISRTVGITNAETLNDFYLDIQAPLRPDTSTVVSNQVGIIQSITASNTGSGALSNNETYGINIAYIYDGFQIGPLGGWRSIAMGASDDTATLVLHIPFLAQYYSADTNFVNAYSKLAFAKSITEPFWPGLPGSYKHQLLSKRVTGIIIYTRDNTLTNTIAFQVEKTIASSSTDSGEIDFVMSAEKILTITITIHEHLSGNTHLQDIGQHNLFPNFKYGAGLSNHFIAAAIRNYTGERKSNNLIASIVDGAGVATHDNFGASNVINLGFYGGSAITGIQVVGDEGMDQSPKAKALIFTDDDYYVLDITPGASFSHKLDNIGDKEGLVAPNSLTYAEGNIFGVSRNGFRIFTPNGTRIIGEGIKTDFDSLTDPTDALGAYHKKDRILVFHFPTDGKTYAVDLLSKDFQMFEYSWNDTMVWLTQQRTGDLLAIDTDKIFQIGSGSDQDGTKIVPLWRSKRFNAADLQADDWGAPGVIGDSMSFVEGYIKYKSDTAITLNFYRENSSSAISFNSLTLAAKSTEGEDRFLFPMGVNAYEAEVEVTLSASQQTSNTSFELNSLRLKTYINGRID